MYSGAFTSRLRAKFHVSLGVLLLLSPGPAVGLTINLVQAPAGSTLTPVYDPNLVQLGAIMQAAADYWEGIILNNHNMTVTYGYFDFGPGIHGWAEVTAHNGLRTTSGNVAFDIESNSPGDWFFDPTPTSHSEFSMHQVLYRDLAQPAKNLYYDGSAPELLEVGLWGNYIGPDQGRDALTNAVHELGHLLGLSEGLPNFAGQISDGEYDFNPVFTQGAATAVNYHGPGPDDRDHVRSSDSLMAVGAGNGDRNLPSATDLFALASVSNWTLIDMPRKDFWGNGATNWNASANWTGNRLPDAADDVHVRNGATASLTTGNGQARNLWVQEDAVVSTGDNTLNVSSFLTIEGSQPGQHANVVVNSNGRVTAQTIRLNDGGLLTVTAGVTEEVEADTISITSGGVLLGNGDVRVNTVLVNEGTITAIAGAGDRLNLLTGPFDLDGSGAGQVFASLGDLRISGNLADAFDGLMTIANSHSIEKFGSWQFAENATSDAELRLQGGTAVSPSELRQATGTVTFAGGTIHASETSSIVGSKIFESGANVQVDPLARLSLEGATTLRGGTYVGDGLLRFDGNVTVDDATVIDVSHLDLDYLGATTIQFANSRLTLNAIQIDEFNNRFDGVLQMDGFVAGLTVNLDDPQQTWQMDGTLLTNGGTTLIPQASLAGNPVELSGQFQADGVSRILAPLTLSGTLQTNDAFTQVQLANASNAIRNTALLSGPGALVINANAGLAVEHGASIGIDVINRGRLEPGTSIGVIGLGAEFTQQATGTFAVDIDGPPGGAHDRMNVALAAGIAGELEVRIVDGFAPQVGHVYTLMAAPSITGTFDTLTLQGSHLFTTLDATVSYPGDRVQLVFTDVALWGDFNVDLALDCADVDALVSEIANGGMQFVFDLTGDGLVNTDDLDLWLVEAGTFNVGGAYLPGDANLDGVVDGSDFIVWNTNKFTSGNGWCGADFNADGVTDGSDFIIWNSNKFLSSTASAATVPEPNAAQLALVGLGLWWTRRRRGAKPPKCAPCCA